VKFIKRNNANVYKGLLRLCFKKIRIIPLDKAATVKAGPRETAADRAKAKDNTTI